MRIDAHVFANLTATIDRIKGVPFPHFFLVHTEQFCKGSHCFWYFPLALNVLKIGL